MNHVDFQELKDLIIQLDKRVDGLDRRVDSLESKIDFMSDKFCAVDNPIGFTRCVEREGRIKATESRVKEIRDSLKWTWRTIFGAGFLLLLRTLWDLLMHGGPK